MSQFKPGQRVYYVNNGEKTYGTFVQYNDRELPDTVWAIWGLHQDYGFMPTEKVFSDEVIPDMASDPEYEDLFI